MRVDELNIQESEGKNEGVRFVYRLFLYAALGVLFVCTTCLAAYLYLRQLTPVERVTHLSINEIGDAFAILNTWFSGLALVGVVVAILYQASALRAQQEDLRLQRADLAMQRKELSAQKEEFRLSNRIAQRQQFENTFFAMAKNLREITREISYGQHQGISAFKSAYGDFQKAFSAEQVEQFKSNKKIGQEAFDALQDSYWTGTLSQTEREQFVTYFFNTLPAINLFDQYFRMLYRVLKLINEEWQHIETQGGNFPFYQYTGILKTQLSPYELIMLYYSALSHPKMKKLIEKHQFFNALHLELLKSSFDISLYNKSAFGDKKIHEMEMLLFEAPPGN